MPTINIQNIGSGATAAGKTMHHADIPAFAAWVRTRDMVANDEQVLAHVYNNFSSTADVNLSPTKFSASNYARMMPAPGLGVNDLDPTGVLDYGTVGIELVINNNMRVSHGMSVEGFRILCANPSTTVPAIFLARAANASPYFPGIYDCRMLRNRIRHTGSGMAAVSCDQYASTSIFSDNLVFGESATGVPVITYSTAADRNTYISRGAGAGRPGAESRSTSVHRDSVFAYCGAVPVTRTSGTFTNNFTDQTISGTATGFTVNANLIESATDARPKAGGALIDAASASADNTTDIRGGFRGTVPDAGAVMRTAVTLPAAPNATITDITVVGQRVTVTGTFTSNVTGYTADLTAAATPNGAVSTTGVVTFSGSTFTAVFSNVIPGNYNKPSVLLSNQGGTGTSSGGQATTVPVPPIPVVKILSQTRNGVNVTLTGTFNVVPTSASITMAAAATANGAVTKGPQAITLNDNRSFSATLSSLTPGSYDAPVVSATNFSGTGTATGEQLPRIYANGTQPVGAEPAVVLPAYTVPSFTTPAVALNAEVTDVTLVNTSASAKTNVPFTFGQPFKQGDLAPGSFLVGKTAGQPDVPLQFNVKTTHPDGSVRHAMISGVLPTMAASQARVLSLVRVSSSTATTVAAASSTVTSAGFSAALSAVIGGVTYTASPNALLAANTPQQAWLGGSVATDWITMIPLKNASNVAHATLTAQFSVRYYPGASAAKVDIVLEDTHPFDSLTEITLDLSMSVGGVTKYSKAGIITHPAGRFKKTFWWGTEPTLHIKHNIPYLIATKQVPNYDQTVVMEPATLDGWASSLQTSAFDPYNYGILTKAMGTTGGRPDIGPLPHFGAATVISMDKRAKDFMLAHADVAAGAWGAQRRDHTTGPGGGRPVSIMYFPYATRAGTPGDAQNPATGQNEKFNSPGYGEEVSHQPSMMYLPYLLTGDFFYLEGLHFWANFNLYQLNPGYRNYQAGLVYGEQTRGQGWCLRTMAHAAAVTPDAHPDKAAYIYWLKNNIDYYNVKYTDNPDANIFGLMEGSAIIYPASGANPSIGVAPWQDDYFTIGVGHASELGFSEATRLLRWKAKFQVSRLLAPGYCYIHAAIYTLNMRATKDSPLYGSFAECLANSIDPNLTALPCNSQARLDYMNSIRSLPSNPIVLNEITGYANGTEGYPSILQTAMAYVSDTDYPDADLAWDLVDGRAVKPNYGTSPQFAIVSRQVESAAASSLTLDGPTEGAVGEPSALFTVGTNAPRTTSVLVTPTRNGNTSGIFDPPTITLPPGSSFATFTYTPSSSGIKVIGLTNDGGLSNPATIDYNAVSVADTTPPTMVGPLSQSLVTNNGFTLAWPAAQDNAVVAGYEYSINAGPYVDIGNVLSRAFTGLAAGTPYGVNIRAYDTYGNRAITPLNTTVSTLSVRTATIRLYRNGQPAANLTGLKWAWHDQTTPDQYGAPTDQGSNGTTNAQGYFTVTLPNSKLSPGSTGALDVSNSSGSAGVAHQAFSGPVVVA